MRLGATILAALAALAAAAPAEAKWLMATSRHFVVYGDTSEEALRRQATELEHFDVMLRRFHGTGPDEDAEFNRVTVYVLPSVAAVQKLARTPNAYGFYVPRVEGSIAFTPRASDSGPGALNPRIVLFHEYAHHFLLGNSAVAYPAWFVEGYAEFCSTMMQKDGAYWLGAAANHRGYTLFAGGQPLSIPQLFAPPSKMSEDQVFSLYARGWLLTHYLMFDAERRKQLARYLALFNAGKPSLDAATEAFGDLGQLDKALGAYLSRRRIPALSVPLANFPAPAIEVRPLTRGEEALIDYRMESTRGITAKTAGPLYAKAAVAAAPFGKDAVAQGWLAEMAYDAGNLDAAGAAADAAIAADPASSQALLYKARIHLARVMRDKATDPQRWTEARSSIIKANRAQPNDAAALALFYQTFLMERKPPSKGAVTGLYRAAELAPQDKGVRFLAARQLILDGQADDAKQVLRALASDPHSAPDGGAARLLALLESGQTGRAAIDALEKAADTSEAKRDD